MTETEETGVEIEKSQSPTPGDGEQSTVAVDEEAIRASVREEMEAKWSKERSGLQTALSEERRKRQEYEQQVRTRAEADPDNSDTDVDAIVERKLKERDEQARQRRESETLQQTYSSFQKRKTEAAERHDGVNLDEAAQTVGDALSFSRDLQMQLMQAENSWDLIAHLHQNPEKLQKLAQSSEVAAGIELGRIEASLHKRPSVTNAPDPITPLSGGSSDVEDIYDLDLDQMEAKLKERNGGSVFPR